MLSRQAIVDMFTRPAMLIDGRRSLHGTNRAADRQLAAAQWVSQQMGLLACTDPDSEARLSALIVELALAGQMRPGASPARWLRLDDAPRVSVKPATLAKLKTARTQGAADLLLHDFAIETDDGTFRVSFDDLTLPQALKPLVAFLARRLQPLPPSYPRGRAV